MRKAVENWKGFLSEVKIINLRYADDTSLIGTSVDDNKNHQKSRNYKSWDRADA